MNALEFAAVAHNLAEVAHRLAFKTPAFRSPPRDPDRTRTVIHHKGGSVVSVKLKDRADDDVIDDMVLGLLLVNNVSAADPRAAEVARSARYGMRDNLRDVP